jgi:hypothetical protein
MTSAISSTATAVAPAKVTSPKTVGRRRKSVRVTSPGTYAHVVDPIIIAWLYISLPLVVWDCGYVLGRPLTMPGGSLHSPIFTPYGLYGTVDYNYGFPAWNDGVGFTGAQGSLNVIETAMYAWYLYVLAAAGQGTGWYKVWQKGFWTENIVVQGEGVARAVVICFASAIMTLSKTVLYCKYVPRCS